MTYVAVVAIAAVVLVNASICGGLIRSLIRQQARERELLLDKLMHLAGRTWTPPPGDTFVQPEPELVYSDPSLLPDY